MRPDFTVWRAGRHVAELCEAAPPFVAWDGPIRDAIDHLEEHEVTVETGPIGRPGARGDGVSVYFRDPDGSLPEFITYDA